MPGELIVAHHSLTDWDWQHAGGETSLADDFYVSEPTALKYYSAVTNRSEAVLCRLDPTLCQPQGEIRNWVRGARRSWVPFCFRNQAPLGTADFRNCYNVTIGFTRAILYRWIDGGYTMPDATDCYNPANEWSHFRCHWYNGVKPDVGPALCVYIYREEAGEWVKQGDTMYDTWNLWKDSDINRMGFIPRLYPNYPEWWDDTELWGTF